MDLQLAGKVALVTGGSRGIGKATARQLALEGADVVICARSPGPLEAAVQELKQGTGKTVLAVVADTSSSEQVDRLVRTTLDTYGKVDILVNNAGKVGGEAMGPVSQVTDEAVLEDITFKFMSYLRCARAVTEPMKQNRFGRIINVGGMAARTAGTIAGVRNLSIVHLTKNLSDELGPYGITSNVVHPGGTRTERTPALLAEEANRRGVSLEEAERQVYDQRNALKRAVDASEVADLICFLASPRSASVNGEVIAAAGGVGRAIFI